MDDGGVRVCFPDGKPHRSRYSCGPDCKGDWGGDAKVLACGCNDPDSCNDCTGVLNGVALTLHGASRVCGEVTLEESPTLSGVLHASAIATVSGRYYAHVTLDGEQVGGSPFALSVRSAAAVGGAQHLSLIHL